MIKIAIAVFLILGAAISAQGKSLGSCTNLKCASSACYSPKTYQECQSCAASINKPRFTMIGGQCSIQVGAFSEGECSFQEFCKLTGCSRTGGYFPNKGGIQTCWIRWNLEKRKRRDLSLEEDLLIGTGDLILDDYDDQKKKIVDIEKKPSNPIIVESRPENLIFGFNDVSKELKELRDLFFSN